MHPMDADETEWANLREGPSDKEKMKKIVKQVYKESMESSNPWSYYPSGSSSGHTMADCTSAHCPQHGCDNPQCQCGS